MKYENNTQNPDVVILGAGPVGLWTAINILKANPDMKVTLFERHQTYIRANMIKICDPSDVGVTSESPLNKMFKNELVSILEVENTLLKEARALGAVVQYEVVEMEKLMERYPNTKRFIACDGAHSKTRSKYYGPTVDSVHYFNCIQLTFESEKLVCLSEKQKQTLLNRLGMIVEETITDNKVCLRFFAPDEMFETAKQYVFRTPLEDLKKITHEKLRAAIELWIKARVFYLKEKINEKTTRLLTFKLGTYKSQKFAHNEQGDKIVALCGDSAFGVPFYRSMRNGWVAANIMTKHLFEENFVEVYNQEMEKLYESEKFRANKVRDNLSMIGIYSKLNLKKSESEDPALKAIEMIQFEMFKEENQMQL